MKKLLFILIFIFLSFNVFSYDFCGHWRVSAEPEIKLREIKFFDASCIFYYEDGREELKNYLVDKENDFIFINECGYWIEEIDKNTFCLIPAFETEIIVILFEKI